ncbi:MAG TPA: hypothetical protein VJ843_04455 [Candidatus Saccharimonadales bacterium]|nr:hypothetical protein [Candidatus Saccharimonadales bacterium]
MPHDEWGLKAAQELRRFDIYDIITFVFCKDFAVFLTLPRSQRSAGFFRAKMVQ